MFKKLLEWFKYGKCQCCGEKYLKDDLRSSYLNISLIVCPSCYIEGKKKLMVAFEQLEMSSDRGILARLLVEQKLINKKLDRLITGADSNAQGKDLQ